MRSRSGHDEDNNEFTSCAALREQQQLTLVGELDARSERVGDRWVPLLMKETMGEGKREERRVT